MQVVFLGGASHVGASCLAVAIGQRWILVDAGVRVDRAADRLPDLAFLEDKPLVAIFVTHAHADHIGALPLVHQHFPHVPIYTSPATMQLIEVMLADALKVMNRRASEELEIPLYDAPLVASMLRCLRPLPLPGPTQVPELPGVLIHTSRAGHVAGAVMLGFEAPDGRLVISGDVSVAPQRTVLGAAIPALRHPDLLVLESTYGTRLHPNRQAEEQRLALAVADGVARGHVLIPAFALGRAQEVILILRAAQRDGLIPAFDIWIDGLVRRVCAAYATFPQALRPGLARQAQERGHVFVGKTVRSVDTPAQRTTVIDGPPCCIISSSGMLTGGPSAWYARRLAVRPEASILITGYQDEEAPGRKLLHLAAQGAGTLDLEGVTVSVACRVAQYSLSAHADGAELAGIVHGLAPRAVALVHGDPAARAALAARLRDQRQVYLPQDGMALTVRPQPGLARPTREPAPLPAAPLGVGTGGELDAAGLAQLWQAYQGEQGAPTVTTRELARAWWGQQAGPAEETTIEALLATPQRWFSPLPGVPGLYRVRAATASGAGHVVVRPDQMRIQASISHHLADAPDLYHRGVDPATGDIALKFHFPLVAAQRYAEALATIAAETGVAVAIDPHPHQGALVDAALAVLPPGMQPTRAPSLHHSEQVVRITAEGAPMDGDVLRAAAGRFQEATGWRLEVSPPGQPVMRTAEEIWEPVVDLPPLELNTARDVVNGFFGPASGLYKIGADQASATLVLRFHFPTTAKQRYDQELRAVARSTGWRVRVHPEPHQGALQALARSVLPAGVRVLGTPALQHAHCTVVVRCQGLSTDDLAAAQAAFTARSGWELMAQLA